MIADSATPQPSPQICLVQKIGQQFPLLRDVAIAFVTHRGLPLRGAVIFADGKAVSWDSQSIESGLSAHPWRPGVIAQHVHEPRCFLAIGGNVVKGAERWQELPAGFQIGCDPNHSVA